MSQPVPDRVSDEPSPRFASWGSGGGGALALGDTRDYALPQLRAESPCGVTQWACGGCHSLGVTREGALAACGDNSRGALGLGAEAPRLAASAQIVPLRVRVLRVACGWAHSAAIAEGGALWAWGAGESGQLGLGDARDRCEPCLVESLRAHAVDAVACGWQHTLAATCDGGLFGWGSDAKGQLGLGGEASDKPVAAPRALTLVGHASDERKGAAPLLVACGWQFSLVARRSPPAALWAAGANRRGQLGLGDAHPRAAFTLLSTLDAATLEGGVAQIACGWTHCMLLSARGEVWLWGRGSFGQQGDAESAADRSTPHAMPAAAFGGERVVVVAAGSESCAAATESGRLFTWGWNEHGNLGESPATRAQRRVRRSVSPRHSQASGTNAT